MLLSKQQNNFNLSREVPRMVFVPPFLFFRCHKILGAPPYRFFFPRADNSLCSCWCRSRGPIGVALDIGLQRKARNVFCLDYLCNFYRSQVSQIHCRMTQLCLELQFSFEEFLSCCPDLSRHRTSRNLSSWSRYRYLNIIEVIV